MRRRQLTRAVALLLAGSLAVAGCAGAGGTGNEGNGGHAGDLRIGLAYEAGGRGDTSSNDSAYAGARAAADDHGGDVGEVTPTEDGSDRARLLAQLAEQGYDPVVAVGPGYDEALADVAAHFPGTTFAQVDGSVTLPDGSSKGPNVTGLLFADEQGSFLAGAAAALKDTSGRIGFLGGVETPAAEKSQAGYEAGAREVNPAIEIDSQYIWPAGDSSSVRDPARAEVLAAGMFGAGADIVYHVAGVSGTGVFRAAAAANTRAIGVDSDQYETVGDPALQAVIMTSMVRRVDGAVRAFVDSYVVDQIRGGKDIVNDLSTDGVGLATSGGFIEDIQKQIEAYERRIIDGDIQVPLTP